MSETLTDTLSPPRTDEARAYIQNPILRGFNPDPSIVRVENDFYIATSTFEWFPGVQLHHSRDLVHWRLVGRALDRRSQLDMIGNPDSGGVWAPHLSYADGLFYLIYTDVKTWGVREPFKDAHNYLVTAPDICGPWSEPVYLNSSGFDPSLFHDVDGRKWLLNMIWDHRKGKNPFGGILLQEFDPAAGELVGPVHNIFRGTHLRVTEGPHIVRKDGFYYLLTAEGGTTYEHAVTLARSKTLTGPYEVHPDNPLLTSRGRPELELQKAGHGSLVETQTGEWYLAHLCGRPLSPLGRCNLGRETALQRLEWPRGDWPRLAGGDNAPKLQVPAPALPAHPFPPENERDDFDAPTLSPHWQTLRVPHDESWLSLRERPGFLRLRGRESLISRHRQSLVARRLQAHVAEAETCVEFEPETFQQMAGLVAFYQANNWVYLRLSRDEVLGKSLNILTCDHSVYDEALDEDVSVEGAARVFLKVRFERETFRFAYATEPGAWREVGPRFDAGKLSDDYCQGLSFTGTFIGLCAQDLSGRRRHADFDYFSYREDA
ncbi:glycoside hydrolase family 43 protein [Truepera radiovictrix]|uniref:Glycoside hydrolase family 43 n=1 Tax=Truepera radiovictrix (strain DSM 17093 / CIP 108686 / LMG 22925 / RQ-24) TaxID=649638 RepID=D7CRC2_TRURR|nr:glycoside hydrolase family 43 protein [Truepera radiovictrix]ADI15210.1 glycoside hydrolase family 43 [Truepera radiovictrix DSM 17093]WMT56239.1 glycoside hydrolase family 43 protein [Truepera radiovictrix]